MSPGLLKLDFSGTGIISGSDYKDIPFLQELRIEYLKLDGTKLAPNSPNLQKVSLICRFCLSFLSIKRTTLSYLFLVRVLEKFSHI